MGCIPAVIGGVGAISSLFGKGKGKKTEYVAQAPKEQQQFSQDFMKFLQGKIGQGATPYGGQVAASAQNPFTQSALGLWGASPYGQFGGGAPGGMPPGGGMPQPGLGGGMRPGMPPGVSGGQMPFSQLGGARAPGGQRPMPQRPMQRPMPQRGGGMGGRRRGIPFQR